MTRMRRPVDTLDILLVERYLLEVGQAAIVVLRALSQQLFVDLHHFSTQLKTALKGLTNVYCCGEVHESATIRDGLHSRPACKRKGDGGEGVRVV